MIEWVTGGSRNRTEELTPEERKIFYRGGGNIKPCTLQVVILRGFSYEGSEAATYGHEGWMSDFRELLEGLAPARQITLDIFDSPKLLNSGVVLMDKITGEIIHVELPSTVRQPSAGLRFAGPGSPTDIYTEAQSYQDLFISNLRMSRQNSECCPIRLQYDVDHFCLPAPYDNESRQLVRSVRLKEPASAQSAILRKIGLSNDWISGPVNGSDVGQTRAELLRVTLQHAADNSTCQRCAQRGIHRW